MLMWSSVFSFGAIWGRLYTTWKFNKALVDLMLAPPELTHCVNPVILVSVS